MYICKNNKINYEKISIRSFSEYYKFFLRQKPENNIIVSVEGHDFKIIVLEGCEYYFSYDHLAKVDCNCVPKRK